MASTIAACCVARSTSAPFVEACAASDRPEARLRQSSWPIDTPVIPQRGRDAATQLRPARSGRGRPLAPGNLHCYLGGAGIELMGASDNVVRAGLTTKPVDVDTVLDVMDPRRCLIR